jgi:sugar phosphate isomerase/epimerase
MKIGMITDSLGELSFDDLLDTAAELGIEQLEFAARQLVSPVLPCPVRSSAPTPPGCAST